MAKQLRIRTEYTFELLEELQRVVGEVFTGKKIRRRRALLMAAGLILAAAGLLLAVRFEKVVSAVILCLWGVILIGWSVLFFSVRAWQAGKLMGKGAQVNDYTLEKTDILAFQGGRSARYPYTDCDRLLETERCLYVILKSGQGLMLDKEHVQDGTAEELRAWLEEKCGQPAAWIGRKGPDRPGRR